MTPEALQQALSARGLSYREFARQWEVSPNTITTWVKGGRIPKWVPVVLLRDERAERALKLLDILEEVLGD